MKKRIIIVSVLVVIITLIFFIVPKNDNNGSEEEISSLPINYIENEENVIADEETEQHNENQEKLEQIIENQGVQGNTSIYELATEYDGRETLVIKPWIQFQVALTGIIKKEKPEFEEMNSLLNQAPSHTGIWISEDSRDKFLDIINKITRGKYTIDEEGYLNQEERAFMNQYDKNIKQMLSSEKLYVFDISSISYLVDEVEGVIQEYPFEEMDPYTGYEYFEAENKQLYVISENKSGKVNQEDVLKEILKLTL